MGDKKVIPTRDQLCVSNLQTCEKTLKSIRAHTLLYRETGLKNLEQIRFFLADDWQKAIDGVDLMINSIASDIDVFNSTVKTRTETVGKCKNKF